MARTIELFMKDEQDDKFIEENLKTIFINFLGMDETAARFGVQEGEVMKRIKFSITTTKLTYAPVLPTDIPTEE